MTEMRALGSKLSLIISHECRNSLKKREIQTNNWSKYLTKVIMDYFQIDLFWAFDHKNKNEIKLSIDGTTVTQIVDTSKRPNYTRKIHQFLRDEYSILP